MSGETAPTPRIRRRPSRAVLAPFALLALLAVAIVLPDPSPAVTLDNPDRTAVSGFRASLAALPADPLVLIAFDADFGTYPEITYATRSIFDQLNAAGASLAFISYSPEGRALAAGEVDRLLRAGMPAERVLDLGYRSGAEAGLVQSVTSVVPASAAGQLADRVRAAGGGIDAFDAAVLIGGNDLSPRVWVEQVATRIPALPLLAVAPSFLRPELEPYLASGQLAALLGTLRDGVAYGSSVAETDAQPPSGLAMLLGMLVAIGVLLDASAGRLGNAIGALIGGRR